MVPYISLMGQTELLLKYCIFAPTEVFIWEYERSTAALLFPKLPPGSHF